MGMDPYDPYLSITGQSDNSISATMEAFAFDLLDVSGGFDPMAFLDQAAHSKLSDPTQLLQTLRLAWHALQVFATSIEQNMLVWYASNLSQ